MKNNGNEVNKVIGQTVSGLNELERSIKQQNDELNSKIEKVMEQGPYRINN